MLGVTGIVLGGIGAFLSVVMILAPPRGQEGSGTSKGTVLWLAGGTGIVLGTGLILGGLSMAASIPAPSMDLQQMPMTRRPPAGAGAGVSLTGTF